MAGGEKHKCLVNTLTFDRLEYVRLGETDGFVQIPALGQAIVTEEILAKGGGFSIRLYVREDSEGALFEIENRFFIVQMRSNGFITSLKDKRAKHRPREVVQQAGERAV